MSHDSHSLFECLEETLSKAKLLPEDFNDRTDGERYSAVADLLVPMIQAQAKNQVSRNGAFTVISVSTEGKIYSDHVVADDSTHAFAVAAGERKHVEFVASLPGHLAEGLHIGFPGESVVDSETIEEQPDVFGTAQPAIASRP